MSDNTENTNESPQETADEMRVALCASRHPILDGYLPEVEDSIFPHTVKNPLDFDAHNEHVDAWINENAHFLIESSNKLYIYVTGLTPVLTAFLHYYDIHMPESAMVFLMHYNRDTKDYVEQRWI